MKTFIFLSLCVSCAHAARIRARVNATANVAVEGQVLRGRYRLDKYLHTHSRATPGVSFPSISSERRSFTGTTEHLGTGSFGDVWQAFDTTLNKVVAVKIFYQGKRYMTWLNADTHGLNELRDSARECTLIEKILDNRNKYPIGASRICECYAEYINDAKHTDDVVFLVQEMCGQNLQTAFIKRHKNARTLDVAEARVLTKQMIQGLAFLQMFDPPLIHHDLKPANVCVNDKGQVKIIDWGAMVHGTITDMYGSTAATPLYMPPEAKSKITSFAKPYWSYDTYALGLMHMEMVCPMVESLDWYYSKHKDRSTFRKVVSKRCPTLIGAELERDVGIIAALALTDPMGRPYPMKFLHDPHIADVLTPQVQEDEVEQLLIFKEGAEVEYWSTTWQKWMPAVIGKVNAKRGLYDLLHPESFGKRRYESTDWMRRGADPDRVRTPERNLRASVADEFIVRQSRLADIDDANGILASGIVHLEQPVKDPDDFDLQWGVPLDKPRPLAPINEVRPLKVPEVSVEKCFEIELQTPKVYWYSLEFLVDTYVGCPRGVACKFETATVYCGFNAGKRHYPTTMSTVGSLTKTTATVPKQAEIEGSSCSVEVIAEVTDSRHGGKTKKRCRSFTKFFTLTSR